jgi:hypothetical protein
MSDFIKIEVFPEFSSKFDKMINEFGRKNKMLNFFKEVFNSFLAYFQYAIVCAFSSVTASSLQGIDRSCPFMAQSIAYEPETCLKEGNFSGPVLGPTGGV